MKAVRVHQFGGPEVMGYEEVPLPEPVAGEVRVKIEATGVNFIDVYHRKGQYPRALPFILGQEAAGVVDILGPGVMGINPGERVAYAMGQGCYAEYAVVEAWKLVPIPKDVDGRQATALMVQGLTAHYLSHDTYPIQRGDTVLIHAAAGGVGQLLVQMAKRHGARVIATVSTEDKARLASELGADHVILYTQVDFEEETKRLTEGRGVNVVYDSVGQATFAKSLNCLKRRGYIILFGQSSGPVAPIDPQILNAKGSLFLTRPTLGHYAADRQELLRRAQDLFAWLTTGELKVRIDRSWSLAEAAEAHRYLEARKTKGKLLLVP